MSYVNMVMYGAVLPSYRSKKKDGNKTGGKEKVLRADDPRNRDEIRKLLDTFR